MPNAPRPLGEMMQYTLYHPKGFEVETVGGKISWETYLRDERARFVGHGRVAEIREKVQGYEALFTYALWVDRIAN